jgi:hypothetical protein
LILSRCGLRLACRVESNSLDRQTGTVSKHRSII